VFCLNLPPFFLVGLSCHQRGLLYHFLWHLCCHSVRSLCVCFALLMFCTWAHQTPQRTRVTYADAMWYFPRFPFQFVALGGFNDEKGERLSYTLQRIWFCIISLLVGRRICWGLFFRSVFFFKTPLRFWVPGLFWVFQFRFWVITSHSAHFTVCRMGAPSPAIYIWTFNVARQALYIAVFVCEWEKQTLKSRK